MFSPTNTTYLMDDLMLVAGKVLEFFKRTKDYLTAIKLSRYSFPVEEAGIYDFSLISTVGLNSSFPY